MQLWQQYFYVGKRGWGRERGGERKRERGRERRERAGGRGRGAGGGDLKFIMFQLDEEKRLDAMFEKASIYAGEGGGGETRALTKTVRGKEAGGLKTEGL